MSKPGRLSPIGVFDSGVGGLSVLRVLRSELPNESFIYIADQAHVPYGPRSLEEVRAFAVGITHFLLAQGAKMIVVACNAASAAALNHLRQVFPKTPFVGMEPAIKPAVHLSKSGKVAVLATPATFQGALYASVVERFAIGVTLLQHTCPGLVEQIEAGDIKSPAVRKILIQALHPLLDQGVDTVVLGCTHYPFVIPIIESITGPAIQVIDPAPAIARQTHRLLSEHDLLTTVLPSMKGSVRFFTTAQPERLRQALWHLIDSKAPVGHLDWTLDGQLIRPLNSPDKP